MRSSEKRGEVRSSEDEEEGEGERGRRKRERRRGGRGREHILWLLPRTSSYRAPTLAYNTEHTARCGSYCALTLAYNTEHTARCSSYRALTLAYNTEHTARCTLRHTALSRQQIIYRHLHDRKTVRRVPPSAAKTALIVGFTVLALGNFVPPFTGIASSMGKGFYFLGTVFSWLVVMMFVIGELRPTEQEWEQEDAKAVDMTPWRFSGVAGIALIVTVIAIYAWFADF